MIEDQGILQVDFAENVNIKQQNEIMSAYWESNAVTLFTAVLTTHTGNRCFVVISPELQHDKFSVITFLREILQKAVQTN